MNVLVLGDIHGRNFWRKVLADNVSKVSKVIFLGDYLDPYPKEFENPESMECKSWDDSDNLLIMLSNIIELKKNEPSKYILLTGNHSDSYIWSNFTAATRTDKSNWEKYHKFFIENLSLFNLVWIEDNTIFSHAGITKGWANDSSILEVAKTLKDISLENLNNNYINLLSQISWYRGGDYMNGSCEWADLREHIDKITDYNDCNGYIPAGDKDIFQVFGHTQLMRPLINELWACLDCRKGFIVDTITHEITECEV